MSVSLPSLSGSGIPLHPVDARISFKDRLQGLLCRVDVGRSSFRVEPGLYALGAPGPESPVFVSANYGLSFNVLRQNLSGLDGWILVIDTKGINVWCAAGKGTFGTAEIIRRVLETRLADNVTHRKLIVPQLGAPGVSAHEVRKGCGFSVTYGPVRARDIKAFLAADNSALPEMRRVRFPIAERVKLLGVELVGGARYALPVAALFFILSGITSSGYSPDLALNRGARFVLPLFTGLLAGAIITPLFLPFIPGRMFAVKGLWAGLLLSLLLSASNAVPTLGGLLMSMATASFLAMNFTGASTFTSLSGVLKEMKFAVPFQIALFVAGIALTVYSFF